MSIKTSALEVKKLLLSAVLVSTFVTASQAGAIVDVEIGGGMWSTSEPTGTIEATGPIGTTKFDLVDQAALGSTDDNSYIWVVFDHPVPIIPNLRIEQTVLKSTGTKAITGGIPGLFTTSADVDSTLDLSHTDFILYWGVPFGTWLPFIDELDFGIGAKAFNGSLLMEESLAGTALVDQSFAGAMLPYGYGKLRVEPPLMLGLGFEAEVKYLSIDLGSVTSDFTEAIVKADWGFTAPIPVVDIKAGLEVGYRQMIINIDAPDLNTDVDFSGVFFGLYGKFGI